MSKILKVGIIGASAHSGWARDSHVPAVQGLKGIELSAVATSTRQTADAAADAFGVRGYAGGLELIDDPEIDIVTIATRVPDHCHLVLAAAAAGKHIYCEWPLGRGSIETKELALSVKGRGIHTAIGLQMRSNPAFQRAQQAIAAIRVGRVLSMNIYSSTAGFGPEVADPFLYLEDPANFANLITIQAAHTVDLAVAIAGNLTSFNALPSRQYPTIRAGNSDYATSRRTFDHLALHGTLSNGAILTLEVAGGRPTDTPFRLELVGETGTIKLLGGAPRGFQSGRLRLYVNDEEQAVEDGELASMPDGALNVAGVYASLRDDIMRSTVTVAGFDRAEELTSFVEDVLASSAG
jgi:predicted dehydrogenase